MTTSSPRRSVASRDTIIAKKQREKNTERQKSVVTESPSDIELREKHRIFAEAIMNGASQSDAARAAGYHPSTASTVMRSEDVQIALAEARKDITDATTISRLDVLNVMIDAIAMARTLADPATMIKGASEIGKMMGYYEPEKIDIRHITDENVFHSKLKQLTDAELLEIASGRAKVIEGEVVNEENAHG